MTYELSSRSRSSVLSLLNDLTVLQEEKWMVAELQKELDAQKVQAHVRYVLAFLCLCLFVHCYVFQLDVASFLSY